MKSVLYQFICVLLGVLAVSGRTLGCDAPTDLSTTDLGQDAATLTWIQAGSQAVELQWRAVGTTDWETISPIQTGTYRLSALASGTSYEWQLRTVCADGGYSVVASASFSTDPCSPPANLGAGLITRSTVIVSWQAPAVYVSGYTLRWRPVGTVTWNVKEGNTSLGQSLAGLISDTDYEWQVQSVCSSVVRSDFVSGPAFRTLPCLTPTDVSVVVNSVTLQKNYYVRFFWSDPTTGSEVIGTKYELNWRKSGIATPWNSTVVSSNNDSYQYNLEAGTEYEFRVRTLCSAASSSTFSSPVSFTTVSCVKLQNLNTSYISINSANLNWQKDVYSFPSSAQAYVRYDIKWRAVGTATWNTVPDVAFTTYTLKGLVPGTTYEWQLKPTCSATETAPISASQRFQTLVPVCTMPTGLTAIELNSRSALVTWTYQPSAIAHDIRWRPLGTTTWTLLNGITSSTTFISSLTSNKTYEWQIRAVCAASSMSDYSVSQTFTTPACGTPIQQEWYPSGSVITLVWPFVEQQARYEVRWWVAGTSIWNTSGSITEDFVPGINPRMMYSITGLAENVSYTIQVRTLCMGGEVSDYSSPQTIQTICRTAQQAFARSITTQSAVLSLGQTNGVPWDLQWRLAGSSNWTDLTSLTESSYLLTGLTPQTIYQFRGRIICPSGPTTYSDVVNFVTL